MCARLEYCYCCCLLLFTNWYLVYSVALVHTHTHTYRVGERSLCYLGFVTFTKCVAVGRLKRYLAESTLHSFVCLFVCFSVCLYSGLDERAIKYVSYLFITIHLIVCEYGSIAILAACLLFTRTLQSVYNLTFFPLNFYTFLNVFFFFRKN